MPVFRKDPDATLEYVFDWSAWLDEDTITTASVTADDGITVDSDSNTDSAVTVWLSGGTADASYGVLCQITTAGGRTDQRSMTVAVRER